MACFIVPMTEAIVTSVVTKVVEKKEASTEAVEKVTLESHLPWGKKLKWLSNLLWGGSFLLAFEHLWHGEIEPFFPFLTAVKSWEGSLAMLHEMATTGVMMAVAVTLFWVGMVAVSHVVEKSKTKEMASCKKEETV